MTERRNVISGSAGSAYKISCALVLFLGCSMPMAATQATRNLKVLPKDIPAAELAGLMVRFSSELGVQCQFCHAESAQGIDFASDESPAKLTARVMIGMLNDINTKYLAQVSDRRYAVPLTCGNCHQGQTTPPVYEARPVAQAPERLPQASASVVQVPASVAQAREPTVDWVASWAANTTVHPGGPATLELAGQVSEGWHVYALTQRPGGPIPLRVTVDENPVATVGGALTGSVPESRRDPSFNLQTEFYTHSFAVHVPIALKSGIAGGKQLIPVSVRFQTCSERECRPPKTIHLSVPVEVIS